MQNGTCVVPCKSHLVYMLTCKIKNNSCKKKKFEVNTVNCISDIIGYDTDTLHMNKRENKYNEVKAWHPVCGSAMCSFSSEFHGNQFLHKDLSIASRHLSFTIVLLSDFFYDITSMVPTRHAG